MITIRLDSKFQIIAQLIHLIRFEMKKNTIRTALHKITVSSSLCNTYTKCQQHTDLYNY